MTYRAESREAYLRMLPRLGRDLAEVVTYMLSCEDGSTADEARIAMGFKSPNQIAPRFTKLVEMGILVRSEKRRLTSLGRPAAVHYLANLERTTSSKPWSGCALTLTGVHVPGAIAAGYGCIKCKAVASSARSGIREEGRANGIPSDLPLGVLSAVGGESSGAGARATSLTPAAEASRAGQEASRRVSAGERSSSLRPAI